MPWLLFIITKQIHSNVTKLKNVILTVVVTFYRI